MSLADLTERPEDTARRFAGYLVAVEELHAVRVRDVDGYTLRWCRECGQNWPCPTLLAARGEGSPDNDHGDDDEPGPDIGSSGDGAA